MKVKTQELEGVTIEGNFEKGNTIIELPKKDVDPIHGIRYPQRPYEENYHLSVAGAIFHPATAIYRLTSKQYKEEKRHYHESKERVKEDVTYKRARKNFYDALELLKIGFDEYYMTDFLYYMGFTLERASVQGASYDLYISIPKHLEDYYAQQKKEADD